MKSAHTFRIYTPEGPGGEAERQLIREHKLSLYVNDTLYASFSCMREHLPELVCGQLLADGCIRSASELSDCRFSADERRCDVALMAMAAAGAGLFPPPAVWKPEWVFSAARRFANGTALHRETAAVHAAYLNRGGEAVRTEEDISRRCAVLKALGAMSLQGLSPEDCWLFVSCRVNEEMIRMIAAAGVGLLASKSVATADAVACAKEHGVILICRAWTESFEICR